MCYFSFYIIRNGSLTDINYTFFGLFFINGLLTLFVQPLIYFYEKSLTVSDVSLLELSDITLVSLKNCLISAWDIPSLLTGS